MRLRSGWSLSAPLGALTTLACAVFLSSLLVGARRIDDAERAKEMTLIQRGAPQRVSEVAAMLNPFVTWEDALTKLEDFKDRAWADKNIGTSTRESPMFERAVALDYDDHVVYASDKTGSRGVDASPGLMSVARPLVARVRAIEAHPDLAVRTDHTPRASRIAVVDGEPVLVSVIMVSPDSGKRPSHPRHPLMVMQARVSVALRDALAARHLLPDMRVQVSRAVQRDHLGLLLQPGCADRCVWLEWTPERPGRELLVRASPFLLAAALLVMAATASLVLRARYMAGRLVSSQDELRRQALQDPLTGLANRLLLSDRMSAAREALRRRPGQVAVLCLDLDRFKEVNDSYGHDAGDELIQEVGRRLRSVCRAEDTVARLGGDEFAVVQIGLGGAVAAANLAERVVEILSGPVRLKAGPATLSCSVGVAVTGDPDVDQVELMRQADLALYRAKERGRGRYCFFEPEMDQALKARKALERDLRAMLADGGPTVHYQPLMRADGSMFGVEALARWNDPARGAVSPVVFVKLAEESGLIGQLSDRVFRRACLDGLRWPHLRMAVNLSPVQFREPGFLQRLEAIVAETGADPARMDLEITESCLIQDDRATHEVLAELRRMGFSLALDDFGTGYSSLSYLHRYPVQKLKLDRAFTARLGAAPEARAIAEAMLGMARALNLQVLAEGVETQAQFAMLSDIGCVEFQGFLFASPMDPTALEAFVTHRTPSRAPAPS